MRDSMVITGSGGVGAGASNTLKGDRSPSRIENDTETVKMMVARVEAVTGRIVRHARSLGYFEPPPASGATVAPVITTLADALGALDRVLDECSGSLNVFD